MKWIVGLGNPGSAYAGTRHNVGFAVVQRLADQHGITLQPVHSDGHRVALRGTWQSDVSLWMPQLMMNNSGGSFEPIQQAMQPADTLIVHDDVNLPLGTLRLRAGGSAGGHHGLTSCLERLGTEDVPRLRLGVGATPVPRDLTEFVLSTFDREERAVADHMITRAAEACGWWCSEGIDATMNRVNG